MNVPCVKGDEAKMARAGHEHTYEVTYSAAGQQQHAPEPRKTTTWRVSPSAPRQRRYQRQLGFHTQLVDEWGECWWTAPDLHTTEGTK